MADDEVSIIIRGDAASAISAINSVGQSLTSLASGAARTAADALGAALSKMMEIGEKARQAAGGIGLLGTALTALAVTDASALESALAKIQGLALSGPEAGKQIGIVRNELLDLATKVPVPMNQLSDAMYHVLSAGIQVADAEFVLQRAAMAATAGHSELTPVLNTIVGAMNAYNVNLRDSAETQAQATHFTDVMTKAVQLGNVEFGAFAGSIGRVLPMAHALGVSIESAAADMAVLTHAGNNASEAATQLSAVFNQIIQRPKQGVDALSAMGTSYGELLRLMQGSGGIPAAFQFLDERLKATTNSTDAYDVALRHVFPNIRALRDYLASWASQDTKFVGIYEQLLGAAGVTDTAFNVAMTTLRANVAQIKNLFTDFLTIWGTPLLAPLEAAAKQVESVMRTIIQTMQDHPDWVAEGSKIVAVASALMALAGGMTVLHGALTFVGADLGGVFIGARQLTGGLLAILGPIGLLVSAIATFSIAWNNNFLGMRDTLENAGFKPILDGITHSFSMLGNAADDLIHGRFAAAFSGAGDAVGAFRDSFKGVGSFITKLFSAIGDEISNHKDDLARLGSNILDGLGDVLSGGGSALSSVAKFAGNVIEALGSGLQAAAPKAADALFKLLDQVLGGLDKNANGIGEALGHALGAGGSAVVEAAAGLMAKLGAWLATNGVQELLSVGLKLGASLIDGFLKGVEALPLDVFGKIADAVQSPVGAIIALTAAGAAVPIVLSAITFSLMGMGGAIATVVGVGGLATFAAMALIGIGSGKDLAHAFEIATAAVIAFGVTLKIEAVVTAFVASIQRALEIVSLFRQGVVDLSVARALLDLIKGPAAGVAQAVGEIGIQATTASRNMGLLTTFLTSGPVLFAGFAAAAAAFGAALVVANDKWGIFDDEAQRHAKGISDGIHSIALATKDLPNGQEEFITRAGAQFKGYADAYTNAKNALAENISKEHGYNAGTLQTDIDTALGNLKSNISALKAEGKTLSEQVQIYGKDWKDIPPEVKKVFEEVNHVTEKGAEAALSGQALAASYKRAAAEFAAFSNEIKTGASDAASDFGDKLHVDVIYAERLKQMGLDANRAFGDLPSAVAPLSTTFNELASMQHSLFVEQERSGIENKAGWKTYNEDITAATGNLKTMVQQLHDAGRSQEDVKKLFDTVKAGLDPNAAALFAQSFQKVLDQIFAGDNAKKKVDVELGIVSTGTIDTNAALDSVKKHVDEITASADAARTKMIELVDSNPLVEKAKEQLDAAEAARAQKRIDNPGSNEIDFKEDDARIKFLQNLVQAAHTFGTSMDSLSKDVAGHGGDWDAFLGRLKEGKVDLEKWEASFPGFTSLMHDAFDKQVMLSNSTGILHDKFGSALPAAETFFGAIKNGQPPTAAFNVINQQMHGALQNNIPALYANADAMGKLAGLNEGQIQSIKDLISGYYKQEQAVGQLNDGNIVFLDAQGRIIGAVQTVGEKFDTTAAKTDGFSKNIGNTFKTAADAAKAGADAIAAGLSTGDAATDAKLLSMAKTISDGAKKTGQAVPEGIAQGVSDHAPKIDAPIADMGTRADKGLHQAFEYASPSQLGVRAGASIPEGIAEGVGRDAPVTDALAALGAKVVAALDAIGTTLLVSGEVAGEQAGAGLALGINNSIPQVTAAAGAMAAAATAAANTHLQIQSPSKVFQKIGQQTAEGFALGVDDGAPLVYDSVNAVIDAITHPNGPAFPGGRPELANPTDPNNPGTVIMTQTAEGIKASTDPTVQTAADAVAKIASAFSAGLKALADISSADLPANIDDLVGPLTANLKALWNAFNEGFGSVGGDQATKISAAADAVSKTIAPFNATVSLLKTLDEVLKSLKDSGQTLDAVTAPEIIDSIAAVLERITNEVFPYLQKFDATKATEAGTVADTVSKIISTLTGAVTLIKDLPAAAGGVSAGTIDSVVAVIRYLVDAFDAASVLLDAQGMKAAAKLSDDMNKILGVVKNGLDVIKAMHENKTFVVKPDDFAWIASDITVAIQTFLDYLVGVDLDGVKAAGKLGDSLTHIVTILKDAIDIIKSLKDQDFSTIDPTQFLWIGYLITQGIQALDAYIPTIDQAGLEASATLSGAMGSVLTALKAGIDVLTGMKDLALPSQGQIASFIRAVIAVINQIGPEAAKIPEETATSIAQFGKAVQDTFAGLNGALSTIKAMSDLKPTDLSVMSRMFASLNQFIPVILKQFLAQAGTLTPADAKKATEFSTLVKAVFDALNGAMTAIGNADTTKTLGGMNAAKEILGKLLDLMKNSLLPNAAQFLTGAQKFQSDIVTAIGLIQSAVAGISTVFPAIGGAPNANPLSDRAPKNVPTFDTGTSRTDGPSGGFLAVLHPNEAVLPLSKPGRVAEILGQVFGRLPHFDDGGVIGTGQNTPPTPPPSTSLSQAPNPNIPVPRGGGPETLPLSFFGDFLFVGPDGRVHATMGANGTSNVFHGFDSYAAPNSGTGAGGALGNALNLANGLGNLGQGVFTAQDAALQSLINSANPSTRGGFSGYDAARRSDGYFDSLYGGKGGGGSQGQPNVNVNISFNGGIITPQVAQQVADAVAPAIRANLYSGYQTGSIF